MSELSTAEFETVDAPVIIDTLIENHRTAERNLEVLKDVLYSTGNRDVRIECISSAMDLGGFFVDEEMSGQAYRGKMFVGPGAGDAVRGTVVGLVAKQLEFGKDLRLQVHLGGPDGGFATECYFDLKNVVEGCFITRLL